MVFHWSLSDSKSPSVYRTLLSILVDLNNAEFRIFSIHPLISNSSRVSFKIFGAVPSLPITISITVNPIFYSFFSSLQRSKYLYIIIIIICSFCQIFTPTLADNLSLRFKWQQVFSRLLVSSQYSGQSQQDSCLNGLHLSSYFQVLQSLYQSFDDCTTNTNYNWYNRHFHIS